MLACLFGVFNVLAMFAGVPALYWPFFLVAAATAIVGLFKPGDDDPRNGRVVAIFAILFGALPFIKPHIEYLAYLQAERVRARETSAIYGTFAQDVESFGGDLNDFQAATGSYPSVRNGALMPVFDTQGRKIDPPAAAIPRIPPDPFDKTSSLRAAGVGTRGALIYSAGQDGVREFPPPPVIMDAEPNHPLGPFAATGVDLRTLTYDPTNGALGFGDVAGWVPGPGGMTRDEAFADLDHAWDQVNSLTPPRPRSKKAREEWAKGPPAEIDAKTAERLIADGENLGAIAAASRAIANRREHPNFWKTEDLFRADLNRAVGLYRLGHVRAAADALNDYLINRPNDPDAHYLIAVCFYFGFGGKEGQDIAKRHFAAAFQIAPPGHPTIPKAKEAYEALESGRALPLNRPQAGK